MSKYTPKQIEKYQRQKYISFVEKITKNLFKMLRDEKTTVSIFKKKFDELIKKMDQLDPIRLDSEYLKETQSYIDRLYQHSQTLDDETFEDIRAAEMSNLNRLQKLKQKSNYKKEKHRHKDRDQDWG